MKDALKVALKIIRERCEELHEEQTTHQQRIIRDDDVLEAGEDMDEDTQVDEEEHESPSNTDKPEQSLAQEYQESDSDSSSPELKKYDNILPLTCNTPKMGHSENMSGSVTSIITNRT
ncbi:hypothetical protein Tco_0247345 [Tanacetum coccineum]